MSLFYSCSNYVIIWNSYTKKHNQRHTHLCLFRIRDLFVMKKFTFVFSSNRFYVALLTLPFEFVIRIMFSPSSFFLLFVVGIGI